MKQRGLDYSDRNNVTRNLNCNSVVLYIIAACGIESIGRSRV